MTFWWGFGGFKIVSEGISTYVRPILISSKEEEEAASFTLPHAGAIRLLSRLPDRGSRGKFSRRLILAPRSPYRPQDKFIYQVQCVESEFRG